MGGGIWNWGGGPGMEAGGPPMPCSHRSTEWSGGWRTLQRVAVVGVGCGHRGKGRLKSDH